MDSMLKYRFLFFFSLSIIASIWLFSQQFVQDALIRTGELGYLGAFLAGVGFVYSLTLTSSTIALYFLAESHNILLVSIFAGLGGLCGDMIIFRFVRHSISRELGPIYRRMGGKHLRAFLHTKYVHWLLPLIGAIIIASPLPDELGVSLLGISHLKTWQFSLLSFIFNTIGIYVMLLIATSII
jgi:hypothetical protein